MSDNKTIRRGKGSPSRPLKQAMEFAESVNNEYGDTICSREHVALALGHKTVTGASDVKVGSLTHFGLLERAPGSCYRISPLALRILMPSSDADGQAALMEAACSPSLYAEIIEKYKGKAIPSQLGNILAHEYGVTPKARERTASNFRESMEYAGLLQNGVLTTNPMEEISKPPTTFSSSAELAAKALSPPGKAVDREASTTQAADSRRQHISISLGLDGRLATIDMPNPTTTRDLDRVIAWANYMKGLVDETP